MAASVVVSPCRPNEGTLQSHCKHQSVYLVSVDRLDTDIYDISAGLGTVVRESTDRNHGHQTHSLLTDPRTTDHGQPEGGEPQSIHGPRTTDNGVASQEDLRTTDHGPRSPWSVDPNALLGDVLPGLAEFRRQHNLTKFNDVRAKQLEDLFGYLYKFYERIGSSKEYTLSVRFYFCEQLDTQIKAAKAAPDCIISDVCDEMRTSVWRRFASYDNIMLSNEESVESRNGLPVIQIRGVERSERENTKYQIPNIVLHCPQ